MKHKIYLLQYTSDSFAPSQDEKVDVIIIATRDKSLIDRFVEENNIILGERKHLYDENYCIYTLVTLEVE